MMGAIGTGRRGQPRRRNTEILRFAQNDEPKDAGVLALRQAFGAVAAVALMWGGVSVAQAPISAAPAGSTAAAQAGDGKRVALDRVVAVVNGDLILESDVDTEERFAAFQPLRDPATLTRDRIVERLIDRTLILQQLRLQPQPPITDEQVDAQLAQLRKAIPECAKDHCETDAGWQKFVEDHGFTLQELRERWRTRMEVLQFIEQRFRMGVRISQAEIDNYYKTKLAPEYQKQGVAAPPEDTIADRIQEVLLQEDVTKLLEDWLKTLRAQGSVRIVKPGEALP
jgi:peptidyl-prolyl cis-trans isomerase SurA